MNTILKHLSIFELDDISLKDLHKVKKLYEKNSVDIDNEYCMLSTEMDNTDTELQLEVMSKYKYKSTYGHSDEFILSGIVTKSRDFLLSLNEAIENKESSNRFFITAYKTYTSNDGVLFGTSYWVGASYPNNESLKHSISASTGIPYTNICLDPPVEVSEDDYISFWEGSDCGALDYK